MTPNIGSDDDEAIVVTRYEDERDPEADADFDRELAKMMSESVETRKFDRRPVFDVALPMRRTNRDISSPPPEAGEEVKPQESNIVKFSLLSKKGNRPQVSYGACIENLEFLTKHSLLDPLHRPPRRLDIRHCHALAARSRAC